MKHIGQRIKELRKANDLTQERLADHLGVTYKAVSKWECGLTVPDLSLIMPLSKILHVTADELLGGKPEENDARRAELNERCQNYWKYDMKENYQIALQAVKEYPDDYQYLMWLGMMEYWAAEVQKYEENPNLPSASELIERSLRHNDTVIEECTDSYIRGRAMWNAMLCCRDNERHEEALKYAEMFPSAKATTRDKAMLMCLDGEEKVAHLQKLSCDALFDFCKSLSEIYWFAEQTAPHVMAALDTEEAVLKTVFPDGNYLRFHGNLYCAYQKRAEFAVKEGDYDMAVAYLRIMADHAKKLYCEGGQYTCGVFEGFAEKFSLKHPFLPYITIGKIDLKKPFLEQVKDALMDSFYAPLREREDYKALLECL